jgi:predicted short-subunit dehydrogenase-like oxidoreductase (DUF2520 family)
MNIIIIGTGNVATVFGKLFKHSGFNVQQVYGRNGIVAKDLADELNAEYCTSFNQIFLHADLYVIAISDRALYELPETFHLGDKLVVHTAASVPKDVLKKLSVSYGVMYPLQTLRKETVLIHELPLLVDANNDISKELVHAVARRLTNKVSFASDEERLKYHVAAVTVNNFSNHLYTLAEIFCNKEGIDFRLLTPLIEETASRIRHYAPKEVLTGPASRNDLVTIDKHINLLEKHPQLKLVYQQLTSSILSFARDNREKKSE